MYEGYRRDRVVTYLVSSLILGAVALGITLAIAPREVMVLVGAVLGGLSQAAAWIFTDWFVG